MKNNVLCCSSCHRRLECHEFFYFHGSCVEWKSEEFVRSSVRCVVQKFNVMCCLVFLVTKFMFLVTIFFSSKRFFGALFALKNRLEALFNAFLVYQCLSLISVCFLVYQIFGDEHLFFGDENLPFGDKILSFRS